MLNRKLTRVITTSSGNRTVEKTDCYEQVSWLEKYASENLFKSLVSLLTGFGLTGIYAYHYSIEYFPTFDIKSAASLILAVAFIGFLLFILAGMLIISPAFIVSYYIIDRRRSNDINLLAKTVIVCFTTLFLAFFLVCVVIVFIPNHRVLVLTITVLVLPALLIYSFFRNSGSANPSEKSFMLVAAAALQLASVYFYVAILSQPGQDGPQHSFDSWRFLTNGLILDLYLQITGAYFAMAWANSSMKPVHKILSLLGACALPLVIAIVADRPEYIFARIANITKYGNFYATELTLSKDGCKAINSYNSKICSGDEETGYKLCGALIMSRIGSEHFLKVHDGTQQNKIDPTAENGAYSFTRSVFLPSKDVVAMTIYKVKGIAGAQDPLLIAEIAACRAANEQNLKTVIPLRGEEYFEFDKAALGASGKLTVTRIAEKLSAVEGGAWTVTVRGFTDQIGNPRANLTLSRRRASAVADYLRSRLPVALGQRIVVEGAGSVDLKKTETQCPPSMEREKWIACLGENRRTEIIVQTAQPAANAGASTAPIAK